MIRNKNLLINKNNKLDKNNWNYKTYNKNYKR